MEVTTHDRTNFDRRFLQPITPELQKKYCESLNALRTALSASQQSSEPALGAVRAAGETLALIRPLLAKEYRTDRLIKDFCEKLGALCVAGEAYEALNELSKREINVTYSSGNKSYSAAPHAKSMASQLKDALIPGLIGSLIDIAGTSTRTHASLDIPGPRTQRPSMVQ